MGGSNSKSSIFDEHPKYYIDVPGTDDYCVLDEKNGWRIAMSAYSTHFLVKAWRSLTNGRKYEFIYQIIIINKNCLRRRIVIRGVENRFCHKTIDNVFYKPSYNQLNFQAFAYAIIEKNGLRKFNFDDENVYGKSTTVYTNWGNSEVPLQTIHLRVPLLAKHIDEKRSLPALYSCTEDFFQIFHGVHVQLGVEEIKTILKFASKFQVLNVKKYCEQQLIRREDLKVSEKRKFKMACKFNLNILVNQVLRNVKSLEKLAKLASTAIEMEGYIRVFGYSTCFFIQARRPFPDKQKYEFIYQIKIVNKYHLRRRKVIRGVGELRGTESFLSENIYNVHWKPSYNQFNFQAVAYAITDDNGLRKLNFGDENVYGKSTIILATGGSLEVPIQTINKGAPLLANYIDKKKPNPKLKCSEEFFQVFHGVHVQLEVEEIKTLLKFSAKFQVFNVKRYCEQQLIRREDLEVSEKRKFKKACKFNLNILMNQVLRNIESVEELAKLASIAIEMESMDTNISKLLIARMYKVS
ncbi:unnamed protein product [Caenorhabditis brenneri]